MGTVRLEGIGNFSAMAREYDKVEAKNRQLRGSLQMNAAESKKAAEAAVKPVAVELAAIRESHRGGELPGLWWKVKGVATIWYVDYVDGVLMRHSARNPASYRGVGGDWSVITVTAKQRDATALGAPLPDLKVS